MSVRMILLSLVIFGVSGTYYILYSEPNSLNSLTRQKTPTSRKSHNQKTTNSQKTLSENSLMKQPTQQKTQDSSKQPHQSSVTTNQSLSQPLDQSHLKTAHPLSHPVSIPLNDRQDSPNTDNTDEEMIENAEDEKDQLVFSTDREGIKAAFTEINHQVNECYSAWLKENPSLEGRVVVSFSINPPQAPEEDENQRGTGEMETENSNQLERSQISNAELIVDDIAHPMMSGCILNSVEGMRFEAVEKPISIRYPYRFSAR